LAAELPLADHAPGFWRRHEAVAETDERVVPRAQAPVFRRRESAGCRRARDRSLAPAPSRTPANAS